MLGKFKKQSGQIEKPEIVVKQTGIDDVVKQKKEGIDWSRVKNSPVENYQEKEQEDSELVNKESESDIMQQKGQEDHVVDKQINDIDFNDSRYDFSKGDFEEKMPKKYDSPKGNTELYVEEQRESPADVIEKEEQKRDKVVSNEISEIDANIDSETPVRTDKKTKTNRRKKNLSSEKPKQENISSDNNQQIDEDLSGLNEDELKNLEMEKAVVDKLNKNAKKASRNRLISSIFFKLILTLVWIAGLGLFLLSCSNLYQQATGKDIGFFGIGEAVVSSNSMEPELMVNDLIFYKQVPLANIQVGDTVVYQKPTAEGTILVVHEVIQIGDGYATTKGINNAIQDEPILVSAIVGKYMAKVSQAGAFLSILSTPFAPILIIAILILILVLRVVLFYIKKKSTIKKISKRSENRKALDYFFDV